MMKYNVKNFIFSSTAATYGVPSVELIDESTPTWPINPYGRSKLMIEQILADFKTAYDLHYVVLRYFNAAGAHETAVIGESHYLHILKEYFIVMPVLDSSILAL
jgi:UDP-glucose 4-epimerase